MVYIPRIKRIRKKRTARPEAKARLGGSGHCTPVYAKREVPKRRLPRERVATTNARSCLTSDSRSRVAEALEICRAQCKTALNGLKASAAEVGRGRLAAKDFKWLGQQVRHHIGGLRGLNEVVKNPKLFRRRAAEIRSSYSSVICVAAIAAQKKLGGLISRAELEELAQEIQKARAPRPLASWRKDKGNGEFRTLTSWSARDYAQQVLVSHILLASLGASEFDFAAPQKGGRNAATTTMVKAIRRGCTYWAYADIRDAYGSIRPAHLLNLVPAPRWMVNIAFPSIGRATRSTYFYSSRYGDPETSSRGLPQGAHSSATIQSAVVSAVLRERPELTKVHIGYADDMANGAHTYNKAEERGNLLAEAFASLAPGALCLRVQVQHVNSYDGVNFLGYRLNRLRPNSPLYVRAANKTWTRWHKRVRRFLVREFSADPSLTHKALLRKTLIHIRRWRRSHPKWQTKRFTSVQLRLNAQQAVLEFLDLVGW